jgi:hypothetical protein
LNQNNEKKTSKNEKSQKVKVKVLTLVLHVIYVNKGNLGLGILADNCQRTTIVRGRLSAENPKLSAKK